MARKRAQSTTCEYAEKSGDDHLRLVLQREAFDFVVIDQVGIVDAVLDRVEQLAAEVDLGAVGEMAAMRQRHAEDGVARLQQREVHGLVGLAAQQCGCTFA